MTCHYLDGADTLMIEDMSEHPSRRRIRFEDGTFIGYCPKAKAAVCVVIRLAQERLGHGIEDVSVREACRKAADWLERTHDNDVVDWACRALRRPCQSDVPEIERIVQDAAVFGDLTPAEAARQIAESVGNVPTTSTRDEYGVYDDEIDDPFDNLFNYGDQLFNV